MDKESVLFDILKKSAPLGVAFSGGVDSTYLLWAAQRAIPGGIPGGIVALTADMPLVPRSEATGAVDICEELGVEIHVLDAGVMQVPLITENSRERCYYCKKHIFTLIMKRAEELGLKHVAEGSNVDDLGDYRPGMRAIKELGVISPLLEAGFTKDDIRYYSERAGLSTAQKPSFACLASRFPYGMPLTIKDLSRVESGEAFLKKLGFRQYRLRLDGEEGARIEVPGSDIEALVQPETRTRILECLESLGFKRISLDLRGYRTGSMN